MDAMLNLTEQIDMIDKFGGVPSPIHCWKLNIIAGVVVILFVLSVSFNSILLWLFLANKDLRTPINILIMFMTAINLFGSFSEFSFVITTNITCKLASSFILMFFFFFFFLILIVKK